jgi:hypothetical protein
MNHDALSHSMSTFREWEAAVPFSGRLNVSFAAAPDASTYTEKTGQLIQQKNRKFAASRSDEN